LLRWPDQQHFVFMGYASMIFDARASEKLAAVEGSKIGILKITMRSPRAG